MPRSQSRFALKDNEVVRRLKAGSGKIAGIKCLVAVDDLALVPVEVVGIDFYAKEYSGRGISVEVKPIGGHGSIWVSPSELLDDTPAAKDSFDRKNLAAGHVRKVRGAKCDRERRTLLVDIRAEMNAGQKKRFDEQLIERIGERSKGDPVRFLNQISGEYEAARVAELASVIRYEVEGEPEYD